jgi:hypothetical protein
MEVFVEYEEGTSGTMGREVVCDLLGSMESLHGV